MSFFSLKYQIYIFLKEVTIFYFGTLSCKFVLVHFLLNNTY